MFGRFLPAFHCRWDKPGGNQKTPKLRSGSPFALDGIEQTGGGDGDVIDGQIAHAAMVFQRTDAFGTGSTIDIQLEVDRCAWIIMAPARISGPEDRHGGNPKGGREMSGAAIGSNHHLGTPHTSLTQSDT